MRRTLRVFGPLVLATAAGACSRRPAPSSSAPQEPATPATAAQNPPLLVAAVPPQDFALLPTVNIVLPDGAVLIADLARTPQTRMTGLMFRELLPKDYGMLFAFPYEQELQFWMKNTFVDLDMVWLSKDKRVTVVHANVPRSQRDTPEERVARRSGLGSYVLELPAGAALRHKIRVGAVLKFEAQPPQS